MGSGTPTIDSSFLGEEPRQGKNLNLDQLLGQATNYSNATMASQNEQVQNYANRIGDAQAQDMGWARGELRNAGLRLRGADAAGGQLGGLTDLLSTQAGRAFDRSGPTSIEQTLYRQGEAELGMGRALSPEQEREATQSARSAMAARGLVTSNAGTAAEILNRDQYGTAREAQRRGFAAEANNMLSKNVMDRTRLGGELGSAAGQLANQRGTLANQTAGLGQNIAAGYTNLMQFNPYTQALQYGSPLIGQTYGLGSQMAGDVASFNTNRMDTLYNNWMNNYAGVQTANAQSQSANNAAIYGLLGSGIQAAGSVAGGAMASK